MCTLAENRTNTSINYNYVVQLIHMHIHVGSTLSLWGNETGGSIIGLETPSNLS